MGVRQYRRAVQVLTLLSMLAGCAITYFGVILCSSMSSATDTSSATVTATMLAVFGVVYVAASAIGFVGVTVSKDRLQFLMIYFYANLFVTVVFVLFAYMALVAPSTVDTWLKMHWANLPLRHRPCCRTFDDARVYVDVLGLSMFVISFSLDRYISVRFSWMGLLGGLGVGSLVAALVCVVKIVTVPVVMRHMLTVVNAMFIFVGIATVVYGFYMKSYTVLDAGLHWLAWMLMGVGVVVFVLSLFGILGARAKSRTLLLVYITGLFLCFLTLCVSAISAFTYATNMDLVDDYAIDDVACGGRLFGCSNCTAPFQVCPGVYHNLTTDHLSLCNTTTNDTTTQACRAGVTLAANPNAPSHVDIVPCGHCPEWNAQDVRDYVSSSLHLLGILSSMLAFFLAVAFTGAVVLRRSLASYQTESI
ncbi:Aste57867_22256 [Aphanomyces stellatus]|uniref:Aste57867_22256 protein n=1 Tax=Aphanomyces stellatus TaxID=120398 RepID=A0A485LKD7_9STRA|nr:hypothetical protein As57867_022186 [Aphanomyces stellatus]VFT98923.1 Aste57867_22256 [Aphanomyces stellatus]